MADRVNDERLREIIENTYCLLDEGPILAAELLAARADLREAMELIRLTWCGYESPEWKEKAADLLEKHKETPRG